MPKAKEPAAQKSQEPSGRILRKRQAVVYDLNEIFKLDSC